MHENNVLHRDFKPDNIFVHYPSKNNKTINVENFDPFIDFEIKIGDFGLAWQGLIANMPLTWEVGAALMRSPEYMSGSKKVAKQCIWAFGICVNYFFYDNFLIPSEIQNDSEAVKEFVCD